MKLGIISDIHGNDIALRNCIYFLKSHGVDLFIFLGDIGGYLFYADVVFDLLLSNNFILVMGNHDYDLIRHDFINLKKNHIKKTEITREKLNDKLNIISKIPHFLELMISDTCILFCHGGLGDYLNQRVYENLPYTDFKLYTNSKYDLFFHGHTHYPFIKNIDNKKIVNVGSCGLPRDIGNFSCCVIYNTENKYINIYRIPFDVEKVIKKNEGIDKEVLQCLNRK